MNLQLQTNTPAHQNNFSRAEGNGRKLSSEDREFAPVNDVEPYFCVRPGEYDALFVGAKTYLDPRFKAWKIRLDFQILDLLEDQIILPAFFNLGTKAQPKAGRGSRYRRLWIDVVGKQPSRRQKMTTRVFQGRAFRVLVKDVVENLNRIKHHPAEVYSTIKEVRVVGP